LGKRAPSPKPPRQSAASCWTAGTTRADSSSDLEQILADDDGSLEVLVSGVDPQLIGHCRVVGRYEMRENQALDARGLRDAASILCAGVV
jgi:hypothetical protein